MEEKQEVKPTWPQPFDIPLYVTIKQAAHIAGVSENTMREWANSRLDPIPHIKTGRAKKLIRVAALPEYLQRKEAV